MFIDKVQVQLKAGDGGDGIVSFRHEKFVDKGGPDGGDGGDGGDIVLVASTNMDTLAQFRFQRTITADSGKPGSKTRKHGRSGNDLEVQVPVGTVVTNEAGEVLADFTQKDQRAVVARGGRGGFGNAHFKSSTRQTPRVAEKGEKGEQFMATLEIKMIADVGLIGLPNAGKSTLLSIVSNARPEIADYPFTTLIPNLGVVDVDSVAILFADIPGLIEGASEGKGLGDEFLRHVERTTVLVHLIDAHQDDVAAAYQTIRGELEAYSSALLARPQLLVLSKIDGLDKAVLQQKTAALRKAAGDSAPVYMISSVSREGVQALLYDIKEMVQEARQAQADEQAAAAESLPVITLPETDDTWHVEKTDQHFLVTGRKIERFAERTDFGNWHGIQRLRDIMRKMGIMHQLDRMGADMDDTIVIGSPERGRFKL